MNKLNYGVGFIGTGNIANVHAEAIKTTAGLQLLAVYDPNEDAMKRFATKHSAKTATLEQLLADPAIHAIHILTPPDSHAAIAAQCSGSGKSLFVEKPIGTTQSDIGLLKQLHLKELQHVGVNQNMCFHPAMVALMKQIESKKFGKIRQVEVMFRPVLRQLSANQFSHWMFRSPLNLLLEQAVHPVSQILALLGKPTSVRAVAAERTQINSQNSIVTNFVAAMTFDQISASFNFGVGALYPTWKISVYCDDATIEADMVANTCYAEKRTAFMEPLDQAISITGASKDRAKAVLKNLVDYGLATAGVRERSDSFYLGIKNSIGHFYGALAGNHKLITDLNFGIDAVEVCHAMNEQFGDNGSTVSTAQSITYSAPSKGTVCLLGASGFIGRYTTELLVQSGYRVRAVARTIQNLPDIFAHPNVELVKGDVRSEADLLRVFTGMSNVVNLAHGGGGSNYDEIKKALVDSAVLVAEVAAKAGIKRVLHTGSIAGLYLGDPNESIVGSTSPDPQPEVRGDYARAKALADIEFAKACKGSNIEYVILRPGVVVGKGTHPLHAGLGFFNNEGHLVGWSAGEHNIPFVLVEDVASAIIACIESPNANGKTYNLTGDVKFSVRDYLDQLNLSTQRQIQFHPKHPRRLWTEDVFKNIIKRLGGKKAPFPNIRDFRSRAMFAQLDCTDIKQDTGWKPMANKEQFIKSIFAQ